MAFMKTEASLILASGSPRRSFLLSACRINFSVQPSHIEEAYPENLYPWLVPSYLAQKKSGASEFINPGDTILTADTVVLLNNQILNKPADNTEAVDMLKRLSGNTHEVITAVNLRSHNSNRIIECKALVSFNKLDEKEIIEYVEKFKPLDKAGAYGAQECLPTGYNPCSDLEKIFLKRIGNPQLFEQSTVTSSSSAKPLEAIKEIKGSYFNVMGLPIHLIYDYLSEFVSE